MYKRMIALALSLMLALLGSVCLAEEQAAFPVTVTDAAGREVTIEQAPQRLVSGYYITTSMLIALGLEDRLVGIEAKADSRPIYALAAPELLELPSVGTAKEFDLEGCAALAPDLVILPQAQGHGRGAGGAGDPDASGQPGGPDASGGDDRNAGRGNGRSGAGRGASGQQRADGGGADGASGGDGPSGVYLAGNSSYLSTAGAKMYQNSLIELGGGENVAAGIEDTYWAEISYEQLLTWNPEVIVIVPEAAYTREELLSDPQLSGLDAIENGAVYEMPSAFEAWDSPVPSAMLGSRWMAAVLHGDVYAFETFCADAAAFYAAFYGIEIDTALLTK